MSKCILLASMAVKIEKTIAGHNHASLQQCIFDVHASRCMGSQTEKKNSKNICFCLSNLTCIHGKLNKNNFEVFSDIFAKMSFTLSLLAKY